MLQFYRQNFISKHINAHKNLGLRCAKLKGRCSQSVLVSFGNKTKFNCYIFQCLDSKYFIFTALKFDLQYDQRQCVITMENSFIALEGLDYHFCYTAGMHSCCAAGMRSCCTAGARSCCVAGVVSYTSDLQTGCT